MSKGIDGDLRSVVHQACSTLPGGVEGSISSLTELLKHVLPIEVDGRAAPDFPTERVHYAMSCWIAAYNDVHGRTGVLSVESLKDMSADLAYVVYMAQVRRLIEKFFVPPFVASLANTPPIRSFVVPARRALELDQWAPQVLLPGMDDFKVIVSMISKGFELLWSDKVKAELDIKRSSLWNMPEWASNQLVIITDTYRESVRQGVSSDWNEILQWSAFSMIKEGSYSLNLCAARRLFVSLRRASWLRPTSTRRVICRDAISCSQV